MSQCNTTFDLKIDLGHSDQYLMVQWFLLCYFLLWKTFKFYWQSLIQANYAVLRQLLLIYKVLVFQPESDTAKQQRKKKKKKSSGKANKKKRLSRGQKCG